MIRWIVVFKWILRIFLPPLFLAFGLVHFIYMLKIESFLFFKIILLSVFALLCFFFRLSLHTKFQKGLLPFFDTFEHELTHGIAAIFCLIPPIKFQVNHQGSGAIHLKKSNLFIILAPYIFPLFSLFVLVLVPFLKNTPQLFFISISGLFLGNFWYRMFNECRRHQTDLQPLSYPVSILIIIVSHFCLLTNIVIILLDKWQLELWTASILEALRFLEKIPILEHYL